MSLLRCLPIFFLLSCSMGIASPKHLRDGSQLPKKEREFAKQLSIHQRRIFCGRFNHRQREAAVKYATGKRKDQCLTPDEAVIKVMEETGMSLAIKNRKESWKETK